MPCYAITSGTFNWINPTNMTALALDCFPANSAQALPFSFKFFGTTYSQIYIGDGGIIGFDNFAFQPITDLPNIDLPNNIICPFWDFLTPCTSGTVYFGTVGQTPNRKVVISWVSVGRFDQLEPTFTFQVWLEETASGFNSNINRLRTARQMEGLPARLPSDWSNPAGNRRPGIRIRGVLWWPTVKPSFSRR